MLLNMIGTQPDDQVTDLATRRVTIADDPKVRETLTTLVGAMIASYATSSAGETRVAPADRASNSIAVIALGPASSPARSDAA